MNDVWLRLAIVVAVVAIALLVIIVMRRRPAASGGVDRVGLDPGIYLFTSSTCADCEGARSSLEDMLGSAGYNEIEWENEPGLFAELRIDVVPCTVVVGDDRSASVRPGMPDQALRGLNP